MSLRRGRRLSTIHGGPDFPVKAVWLPQDVSGTGRVPDTLQVSDCARCRARTTWTRRGRQLLPIFGLDSWDLGSTLRQCACHCAARPWRRRSRIPAVGKKLLEAAWGLGAWGRLSGKKTFRRRAHAFEVQRLVPRLAVHFRLAISSKAASKNSRNSASPESARLAMRDSRAASRFIAFRRPGDTGTLRRYRPKRNMRSTASRLSAR